MALNSIYKHNKVVLLRESNYMDYLLIAVRPMPDVFIVKRFNIGLHRRKLVKISGGGLEARGS